MTAKLISLGNALVLPLNAEIGNRVKVYTLAWYGYRQLDSYTKGIKLKDKIQIILYLSVFHQSLIFIAQVIVNYFYSVQSQYMLF